MPRTKFGENCELRPNRDQLHRENKTNFGGLLFSFRVMSHSMRCQWFVTKFILCSICMEKVVDRSKKEIIFTLVAEREDSVGVLHAQKIAGQ